MANRILGTTLLVWACCTAPTYAQGFFMSSGGEGFSAQYPLLMSKPVQKELNLTPDQVKKIEAKIKELMPEGAMFKPSGDAKAQKGDGTGQSGFTILVAPPKVSGVPPVGGGIQIDPSNIRIPNMPDFKKIEEEVLKILEQPQRDRLKQLNLQQQGLSALANEKVANEAGLAEEQRELVKQILSENRKKMSEFFMQARGENGGITPDTVRDYMKKQRETTEKDIALLLSDEQKDHWEKMLGPKFDFKAR
jgi:hypothetical protein